MASNPYPYKECTWWVWQRVYDLQDEELPSWGNAENWFRRAQEAGYSTGGIYSAKPGDILCWGHRYNPETVGHVQYVESDNGTTLTISESYSSASSVPKYVEISKANPQYGQGDGFPFQGVIFLDGEHDDPDDPPPPQPGGHWEWVEETVTVTTTKYVNYTDIYECGVGNWDSGTQDDPKAPIEIHGGSPRDNERWEPFNSYTYERILTYTSDHSPLWSSWESAYTGSDDFLFTNLPSTYSGWVMNWDD